MAHLHQVQLVQQATMCLSKITGVTTCLYCGKRLEKVECKIHKLAIQTSGRVVCDACGYVDILFGPSGIFGATGASGVGIGGYDLGAEAMPTPDDDSSGQPSATTPDTGSAEISSNGKHRFHLTRKIPRLDVEKDETVNFIMLNPSTAGDTGDDATIRRCKGYADHWGFGRLSVTNLFSYRCTDPSFLQVYEEPVWTRQRNLKVVEREAKKADLVIVAWGAWGDRFPKRVNEVMDLLSNIDLYSLGETKSGQPKHPLRLRSDQPFLPYATPIVATDILFQENGQPLEESFTFASNVTRQTLIWPRQGMNRIYLFEEDIEAIRVLPPGSDFSPRSKSIREVKAI